MGWGGEVGWGRVGVCVAKPVAVELRCHATALIAYVKCWFSHNATHLSKAHVQPSTVARCPIFQLTIRLLSVCELQGL